MKKLVLSLFNGMNCIGLALSKNREDFQVYASEIDKYANKVSNCLFPNTINLGDIVFVRRAICWKEAVVDRALHSNYLSESTKQKIRSLLFLRSVRFDLVVAGSPCQGFSFAGKQLNFNDPRSKLFFDFVKILEACKSKNKEVKFLLENVKMKGEYENVITKFMGIHPIKINSALLSAQNRVRLYWTNIGTCVNNLFGIEQPYIKQPKDRGVFLRDILELEVGQEYLHKINKKGRLKANQDKASCFTAGGNSGGNHSDMDLIVIKQGHQDRGKPSLVIQLNPSKESNGKQPYQQNRVYSSEGKSPCLDGRSNQKNVFHGSIIRRLTPRECCRLQTIPEWAIEIILNCGVSNTQIYKMVGNGWTVDVIAYILRQQTVITNN